MSGMDGGQLFPDDVLERFIGSVASLGFDTTLTGRESGDLDHHLSPGVEANIRRSLQDNAQFLVPVSWSLDSAIGLPLPSELTSLKGKNAEMRQATTLMNVAITAIYDAAMQQVVQYGERETPEAWEASSAYVNSAIKGTAQYPDLMLRQGYLAVCTNGVALVGLKVNWSAEFAYEQMRDHMSSSSVRYFRNKRDIVEFMAKAQMPLEGLDGSWVELAYISYAEIEQVKSSELFRFDGLAALLCFGLPGGKKSAYYREMRKLNFLDRAVNTWGQFPDEIDWYDSVMRSISSGWGRATGVPLKNGQYKKQLFTRGLAINFVDARNGIGFLVESVFSELDTALSLISELQESNSGKETPKPTSQVTPPLPSQNDLPSQLQKLAELHSSGVLTQKEFQEAKQKLLS
ncbi:unannotated protein [freshwater metagenome]|uniref:Unannotated protein n=1 Tax=freshwater metagenome TaxID=449393 RepID=A0A6J7T4Y4_9ZZZZ